jgi:hypothetical protein
MSTATITIRQDGYTLHHAVIDCSGDIDGQIKAIIDYVRPQLTAIAQVNDPEAFALQAAVTAYRLTVAAQAKIQQDRTAAADYAAAHIPQEWLADIVDIKARQSARAAAREQRRQERYQRRAASQEIPYTPIAADVAAMDAAIDADLTNWLMPTPDTAEDIQARADLAATRTPYIDEDPDADQTPHTDPYFDFDDGDDDSEDNDQ